MIDSKKRNTLKAISGVTAAAIIPASLSAATFISSDADSVSGNPLSSDALSVAMVSGHGRWHTVKLTNSSNKTLTVKHVYPGIVSMDDKTFDVNSLFRAGPIVVAPGETHVGLVAQQYPETQEAEMPNNLTRKHTFKLSTRYNHFGQNKPVVTTRSVFA